MESTFFEVNDLVVIHLLKGDAPDERPRRKSQSALDVSAGVFHMTSCLRSLWIFHHRELPRLRSDIPKEAQMLQGAPAYAFLLRVASGLESKILGETDIFGQFKSAWKGWSTESGVAQNDPLSQLIQKVFEDTKEIRSRWLQDIGGSSYGTLARKLLRNSEGPVLLVGAGQLARSVAQSLRGYEIWATNRSPAKLSVLAALAHKSGKPFRQLASDEEIRRGWIEAAQAIVCIPYDLTGQDSRRIDLWRQGGQNRTLLHLGGPNALAGTWSNLSGFRGLDEFFNLAKSQDRHRHFALAEARRACDEKAGLRAGSSSGIMQPSWGETAHAA